MRTSPLQYSISALATTSGAQSDQQTTPTPNRNQTTTLSSSTATLACVMEEGLRRDKIIGNCTLESTHRLAACSKQFQQIALTGLGVVAPKLSEALSTVTPQAKARCKNMTIGDPNAPSKMQVIDQAQQRSLQRARMNTPASSPGTDVDGLHVPTHNPKDILLQRLRNRLG